MSTLYFAPDGLRFGDFSMISWGDELVCVFIENARTGSTQHQGVSVGSRLGLATSRDGVAWTYRGSILRPDRPWKARSLWAPSLFLHEGRLGLFYSAVGEGDDPLATQASGLAWSDDLLTWTDSPDNPVLPSSVAAPHYLDGSSPRLCWRDPNPLRLGSAWYCTLVARDARAPVEVAGCVALVTSPDLRTWRSLPPLFSPRRYAEVETPTVYRLGERWFLLFGHYHNGHCMSWAVADEALGPYREPEANVLTPSWCYAGRIVERGGGRDFYHWTRDPVVGRPRTFLAPPKRVVVQGGRLLLGLHPAVVERCSLVAADELCRLVPGDGEPLRAELPWPSTRLRLVVDSPEKGYARTVTVQPCERGLAVHDLAPGDGVFDLRTIPLAEGATGPVTLILDSGVVELYVGGVFAHSFCLPLGERSRELKLTVRVG